jgi:uncharacterized LabA/DUF88 family protein
MAERTTRVVCYIDGFNLYHFIDNHRSWRQFKWLDLKALSLKFLPPSAKLCSIRYYSAYPEWNKQKEKRHRLYVKAINSIGAAEQMGRFKRVSRRVRINDRAVLNFRTHEEKRTDVSLGVDLIVGAFKDYYDIALLVSSDTDFLPAIQQVKKHYPDKQIWVAAPNESPVNDIKDAVDRYSSIRKKHIASSQFDDPLTLPNGKTITKPKLWLPPTNKS